MKYKVLIKMKEDGISYAAIADWIGITRTAVSAAVNKHSPEDTIPQKWESRIIKELRILEALIDGSFS